MIDKLLKWFTGVGVLAVGFWTLISEWDEMLAERYSQCVTINKDHTVTIRGREYEA